MQYAIWRSVLGLSLIAGALSPFALSHRVAPLPLNTRAVGELHSGSLTTMLAATNAPVQDTRPRLMNRGTQLDGTLRLAPAQHMAIHANPFEDAWRAPAIGGINLATGAYSVEEVDIALPATGFSWVVGRSYNARQEASGSHMDSNGVQGQNWFQASQPSIVLYDPAGTANDMVYLMYGADRFAEYKRVDNSGITGDTFAGVNGAAGVFLFTSGGGAPDTYELTDQKGNTLTFFGFDVDAGVAAGQLWTIVDPAGNKAYVGDATTASTAITNGYDGSGRMLKAYDTSDRRYTYTYTSLDSVTRLTEVKAETKTGGTWASPTGVSTVMTVAYGYYTSETYGDAGDLKTVTLTTPLSDSGVSLTQKKYYRYWEGSYDATNNPGYPHGLQYVVDFEGVRKYDWSDQTFDDDFLSASEGSLRPYASAYFKYDTSYRVKEAWFNGECGCSGANNGTYLFEYESNGSFSGTSGYDTAWCTRTVVQRPDTSYMTQYWDEVGQPLSQVITDADPDNTSPAPSRWVTRVERDSNGRVTKVATPANCTGYTHSSGAITASSSAGLIWEFVRETSGALTGFAKEKKYRVGTSGSLYYASETGLEQRDLTIIASGSAGAVDVTRPGISSRTRYPQVTGSSSADYKDTHALTWDGTTKLWLVSDQMTQPAITTGNNGSGSAYSSTRFLRVDGTPSFEKGRDGAIEYREYTKGQLTERIEDADTDVTGDFDVSVGSLSSPNGYHRKTTYTYDAQGRVNTITASDGRITMYYYSKLADERIVALTYSDYETTPKFHGPVEYTVTNQAGNTEVQATVALTSNESTTALTGHVDESDADPITAMDLGTIARLTTSLYNESGGTMQESRLYFVIPSSGAGTDGTNYDPTFFGYDDNGRRVRVKEAHGTITRTVHDKLGRVTGRWMGTNDHGFSGGEASGSDDMVQTEALEYDGNDDDGNGYLTERTLYVQGDSTGQRVTTYAHDAFGRALLQTNPTAPHAFHKYDNEGRNVATGLFSSTASIVVGTDDPTTETANRLALTESFYDEVGQMWKSVRHKIDASDGSDDDTLLHLYWHDEVGRVLKEDGPELAKNFYDRVGRVTHRFVLISDNDTTFDHVDDVAGDFVAEQYQTVYESKTSDDVWMSVRLDRKHDDLAGPNDTIGALDTGADGDRMLLTSTELKGRAQITCSWYDRFGRVTDQVQYGNNGGSTFDRDPLSVPSRSDNELVTSFSYDTDGELLTTTDPRGLVARTERDQAGRVIKEIKNYSSGVNSGNPANPDDNQTVRYEFVDGLRTKIVADMPSGEDDQETVYIYGTSAGTPSAMKASTGHLLRAVKYPDTTNTGTTSAAIASDSSDVVSHAYNAQGQETYMKDQAGNVFETDYDDSGRQLHRRVTTLASGFDGAVRRQSRTYDSLGRPTLVTQYDNATVGSGSVTDEVSYTYDGWSGVTSYKQDKDSAVGGSGYYEMAYVYEKATGGRNTVRRKEMTLPGSKVITIDYSLDDSISRVSKLKDGSTVLAKYSYLGASHVVCTTYSEPGIARTEFNTLNESYSGYLDRFNRPMKSVWWTLAPNPDKTFYDVDISYDRNSNITWVEDNVHAGFDVKYTMDDLDRLIDAEEGSRSSGSITSRARHQTWLQGGTSQLSHTGNWARSKIDLDGDDNWNETDEYDDTRTHNKVNELTARDTDTSGSNNYTLSYDAAGNLTDDGESYKYEYDAFNRLRKVKNQSSTLLAEYRYNGLGHMIMVWEDTEADVDLDSSDVKFYPAYDEAWREVARYRESDSPPKEQFVNATAGLDGYGGSSYINDVVCRNRDNTSGWLAASDGTLEERYYYCPNWRGDVSALVSSGRQLHEMDKYSPYGIPFGLPGGDTNSDGDNDSADATQIQTWIDAPAYDVRGDVDLDGDVDSTDKTLAQGAPISAQVLGWNSLSNSSIGSRRSLAGYSCDNQSIVRRRQYLPTLGVWARRDPVAYKDSLNLYAYGNSKPVVNRDPSGLCTGCVATGGGSGGGTVPGGKYSFAITVEDGHCFKNQWIVPWLSPDHTCYKRPCTFRVTGTYETFHEGDDVDICLGRGGDLFLHCIPQNKNGQRSGPLSALLMLYCGFDVDVTISISGSVDTRHVDCSRCLP
jgi:RHS repeat-associated protein